jgi:signal transduction histidine kinase/ActR/RegA family two-component response regulator
MRHIQTHAHCEYDSGQLHRVTGVNIDITELKQAEEQLRAALRDLSLATDAAQLGVSTWYVQEQRVACDRRLFDLSGVEPVDGPVSPMYLWQNVHPDDLITLQNRQNERAGTEGEFAEEYRVLLPNNQVRWIEARISTHFEGSTPTRVTGVHWDITSRKRAEAERQQLEAQLRQAQKLEALGTLAGGIAHDFNNILGAILGNAELARLDLACAQLVRGSLDEIRKASVRGKELVQRLLAFGRPQDQRRERLHLPTVVQDAVKLMRPAIPASVDIAMHFEPDTPPVLIDAVQISQVIVNLGMNAYQAMHEHKGRIDISVSAQNIGEREAATAGLGPGRYISLTVQDDGAGMTAETVEHVFEPFFTTKSFGQGTGLGLAVVHGIVRAHGGVITIDSAPGRGTRFDICLPALERQTAVTPLEERLQPVLVRGRGQRILYLDDEEALVFLARRLLDRMGYRTSGYTEPSEALNAFRDHPSDYDLFITDLSMPGTSGMDVAKEVLRIDPQAVVVLATGYIRAQDLEEARAIGIREVILKPNTVEELTNVVHTLLSERRA